MSRVIRLIRQTKKKVNENYCSFDFCIECSKKKEKSHRVDKEIKFELFNNKIKSEKKPRNHPP